MDIDSKSRLFGMVRFVGFCAYGAANLYIFIKVDWLLGLILLPLFAHFASRYIVHALFDDLPRWGRRAMYLQWNGTYYEFDGKQIRVEGFDGDTSQMPLIAVEDLENLFKDKARFRIKEGILPASGLLEGINSVQATKAVAWARMIARTANAEAGRAMKLALYIERTLVNPKLKQDHLNTVITPNSELRGLKSGNSSVTRVEEDS